MSEKVTYGVGSHEPIFHRLRTGNSTAEEWDRWRYETSVENLDLLERMGVGKAHIACTKGFGLEAEKPLIERAAKFTEEAARRGIRTSIYIQGFPVYYETFLLEAPEAEHWMARAQGGDYLPWGSQTFRRFIDPTTQAFWEYEKKLISYIFTQFTPGDIYMDNTSCAPSYTSGSRESFRNYLRARYNGDEAMREFGIRSFDAVDLPHFDPIYYPPDAMRVVKDPLLQEWSKWRSWVIGEFLGQMRVHVHQLAPGSRFHAACGACDGLRYNQLFIHGIDTEDRIRNSDRCGMEESGWRPKVIAKKPSHDKVVMDERHPDQSRKQETVHVRISTDARWWKIFSNYGGMGHGGFWGEVDRAGKLVAVAHNFTFGAKPHHLGTIAPLAASPAMFDDIRDVIEWGNEHIDVLVGREERIAPIAVWRGTSTLGFIRHKPVWEACAIEQMLFENHLPFTILYDGGLDRFLANRTTLILPGTQCVSAHQVEVITDFVRNGGSLLLLGPAGTRDERTRVRQKFAFAHLFGRGLPNLEHIGPPHWVPELNWDAMPQELSATFGNGKVALIKEITSQTALDLSRDPYMPERQVMVTDILPPANETQIMRALLCLLASTPKKGAPRTAGVLVVPSVKTSRTTLCEYWRRGNDLIVCLANLWKNRAGGPAVIQLGPLGKGVRECTVHSLLQKKTQKLPVTNGAIRIKGIERFAAVEVKDVF